MKRRVLFPFIALAAVALFSAVIMLLWNALFPAIFGLGTITYWQALGLLVLSKILFGGFRGPHPAWIERRHALFHEKWMSMTDEERAKLRQTLRDRWCSSAPRTDQ
jgi:hypothetical protein